MDDEPTGILAREGRCTVCGRPGRYSLTLDRQLCDGCWRHWWYGRDREADRLFARARELFPGSEEEV
jgi:hypothetical protein